MFLDFKKGFFQFHFKNPKDISYKATKMSIFRLSAFGLNGPFKGARRKQKWGPKRCFASFSDFLTIICGFLTPGNIADCFYSQKVLLAS